MRKILGLALTATLMMSASAFAVQRLVVAPNATTPFAAGAPATTNNYDSCDIGVTPAATLLLPYFEVETASRGTTTLFTITNTSRFPQIAHVTLWTDWSSPVLDFNIFLTGYDVQGINLYDVIVSGIVAPGTGAGGTSVTSAIGTQAASVTIGNSTPASNTSNPNFVAGFGGNCTGLIGTLPPSVATAVLQALTTGSASNLCAGAQIGGNHGTLAKGYVTVDVSAACSVYLPTDRAYYGSADGILYDNTLIGDYQQIGPSPVGALGTGYDAGGNTMVHIHAIPEGGTGVSAGVSNLPFTFYSRYSSNTDRRQPLPSTWAARYIQSAAAGFSTNFKIWREGVTGNTACLVSPNSALPVTNIIRFDEHENSVGFGGGQICSPCPGGPLPTFPETSSNSTSSGSFPTMAGTDVGGWMYLALSNGNISSGTLKDGSPFVAPGALSTAVRAGLPGPFCAAGAGCTSPNAGNVAGSRTTSQNWVVISMFGNINASRLSVDFDAAWLGNGCTPAPSAGSTVGPQPYGSPTGALICAPTVAPCGVGTVAPVPNP